MAPSFGRRTHHTSLRSEHHTFMSFRSQMRQKACKGPCNAINLRQEVLGYDHDPQTFSTPALTQPLPPFPSIFKGHVCRPGAFIDG
jgi:hypothetical protein